MFIEQEQSVQLPIKQLMALLKVMSEIIIYNFAVLKLID